MYSRAPYPPELEERAMAILEVARGERVVSQPDATNLASVVLKVAAPCNLACTYCYEYQPGNDSWKYLPQQIPDEVVAQTAQRIGEYASLHGLKKFGLCFHGGEPLMVDRDFYNRSAGTLHETVAKLSPQTDLELSMQTNGTLLSRRWLDSLAANDIAVCVSLDGPALMNTQRINHAGKQTYDLVRRGIGLLNEYHKELFLGILCVVDAGSRPYGDGTEEVLYQELTSYTPPAIDLLLPYGTWDNPPPGLIPEENDTPYADMLIRIFRAWRKERRLSSEFDDGSMPVPDIRLFSSIRSMVLGGKTQTEAIGPDNGREVVVRTDGSIEGVDALNIVDRQLVRTGYNIAGTTLETVADTMRRHKQLGKKVLSTDCQDCRFNVRDICGGGHIANRYSSERGFDNPSVYCNDLQALIRHIGYTVRNELANYILAAEQEKAWQSFRARQATLPPLSYDIWKTQK